MRSNKSRNTRPELMLRSGIRAAGMHGYRLHVVDLPGTPDLAFPRQKVAVFLNGCFWHRCPICKLPLPTTNREYWRMKFRLNKMRDKAVENRLQKLGWTVLTLWECEVKDDLDSSVKKIRIALAEAD